MSCDRLGFFCHKISSNRNFQSLYLYFEKLSSVRAYKDWRPTKMSSRLSERHRVETICRNPFKSFYSTSDLKMDVVLVKWLQMWFVTTLIKVHLWDLAQSWSQALIYLFVHPWVPRFTKTSDNYHKMISILLASRGLISLSGALLQLLRRRVFLWLPPSVCGTAAVWGTALWRSRIYCRVHSQPPTNLFTQCSPPLF